MRDADGDAAAGGRGAGRRRARRRSTLRREGGPGADQRHRRHARHAGARAGRPASACCDVADVAAAMSVEGAARHRPGVRRRPAWRCARSRARPRRAANLRAAARRLADRGQPPGTGLHRACRTPTRCAARRRCTAPPATPSTTPRTVAERELAAAIDNPVVLPDGRVESQRQLPRRAGRATCSTSWRSPSPTWPRIASGAPTGSSTPTRSHGLPPFLADDPGVDSGPDDRPVHRRPASSPSSSGWPCRQSSTRSRLSAMQEDHVSMGWPAARKLRRAVDGLGPRARDRAAHRRPRRSTCARRCSPAPATGAVVAALRAAASPGPGPTASSRPRSRPPSSSSRSGALLAAAESVAADS